jgi:hypothetical protein
MCLIYQREEVYMENKIVPEEAIERKIFIIRGEKVMLSMHLAELYRVETRVLNQAVKRHLDRFPEDFAFMLNDSEAEWLVSQNVIPHRKYLGGYLPYAFTEQGVAMLSTVLNSEQAVQVNIAIMRAFVKLRQLMAINKELAQKLEQLEKRMDKYDKHVIAIFEIIKELVKPPALPLPQKPKGPIGFHSVK